MLDGQSQDVYLCFDEATTILLRPWVSAVPETPCGLRNP